MRPFSILFLLIFVLGFLAGCGEKKPKPRVNIPRAPVQQQAGPVLDLDRYTMEHIGEPVGDKPWMANVREVDLDQDGRLDIIACESKANTVLWLHQQADGSFVEKVLAEDMSAPVHVEAEDMDFDGDLDIIVSSMGFVFPNNDKIGVVFILENDGSQQFTPHKIIDNTDRVVDARAGDFDGDGDLDLAVAQFGYDQGVVSWMKRVGPWDFEHEVLLNLSGAIHIAVADFDGNNTLDFAALVSQQWEEVHVFLNNGRGDFQSKVIWGSTNEDYSSSGMSLCDLNRDGKPDLVFSNGDGFGPTPNPGPKPWHGVQWLENKGNGFFQFHRIGDLGGAYNPVEADVDGDGNMDVVAIASFNDWSNPESDALVWFRNDGNERFTKHVLSTDPPYMVCLVAGDFDNSGRPSFVTSGFHAYPPFDRQSRLLIWRPTPP